MKKIGIIAEYNPFHNGHMYHINKIKELANPDIIILVMSGAFSSRGDLSIFDKFSKTKQALNAGVDLVIELPLVCTMQRADLFCKYSTDILNLVGVDEIWIGSEDNDISKYESAYLNYQESFKLHDGNSLKKETLDLLPFKSNDILGFFYYKNIKDNNYKIELKTIKRETSYDEDTPTQSVLTSAKAIRNNLELLDEYTPDFVSKDRDKILDENRLFNFLKYEINLKSKAELKQIFLVDEGLENKLSDINKYDDYSEFITSLVSKRYTKSRIKKMLIYVLLNIKKEDINKIQERDINYIRVLGYSDIGKDYLSEIKKDVLIYTNIKNGINDILDIELKTSKILDLIYDLNLLKQEQQGPKRG
ncbi:MAG: nucleotidyltransferase family protein [Acholeplasmatales bacterium]|nr:nucleotidyltransferase family protein [Acholeplasmatales bacterium]